MIKSALTIRVVIVCLYFAVIVIVGIITSQTKKNRNDKEYHGQNLSFLMCVAVGAGEWMGGTSTTGVSEYGYIYGISGAWYTIANGIGICFLAIFFARMFQNLKLITVPEIINRFIGSKSRIISSILLIISLIIVGVSQMIAVGTIGETLLGLDQTISILVLGIGILVYTCLGGMRTVGNTNIINLFVMYSGVLIAILLSREQVGSVSKMMDVLPDSYFSMSAIGFPKISSWVIASVLGACTAQAGLQPILVAKDQETALKSSFAIATLVAPFGLLTAFLGMISKVVFPNLVNAKLALPMLILTLPEWASGIFMSALLAAIISTASPIFLSCGTLFTKNIINLIIEKRNSIESQDKYLRVSMLATFLSGIICICMAIAMENTVTILDMVYFAYSIRGSLFVILLLGIFWKYTDEDSVVYAMGVTGILSFIWVLYNRIYGDYPIRNVSETYIAMLSSLVVSVILSLIERKKKKI